MRGDARKPARLRDLLPFAALIFFILWESGMLHSFFKLTTPLTVTNLVAGVSLLVFFSWPGFERARFLGIPLFFVPFLLRDPVPYIFILLIVVFYIYRNEYLIKTSLILLPIAIVEGLGIALDPRVTLLVTIALLLMAAWYDLAAPRPIKPLIRGILYASFILLLISFSPVDPLAQQKDGTIAYDGFHHKLGSAFFQNDSTTHSTLRYLESTGHRIDLLNASITPDSLRGVSILILETPEDGYMAQEIEAITDFVRDGGGLFVLGDHTNIMNCYLTLNPILHRFGLHLNFDYSMLWEPHFASLMGFDSVEETAGGTLDVNRSDNFILYSLKYTTWADLGDWSAANHAYIGDVMPQKNEKYGLLPICAAANFGRGRVIAIANSDSMSGPDLLYNYDFIRKVMSFLDHENSFLKSFWLRMLLAFMLLFGVFRARLAAIHPLVISVALVLLLIQVQAAMPLSINPANKIALDLGHANIEGYGAPHLYKNVFFAIFAQHYGFNPVLVKGVPDDLQKFRAYATMGPTSSFLSGERDKLAAYVQKGGTIVLFDGYHADTSASQSNDAANSLLRGFGFHLNGLLLGEISYFNNTTWGYRLPYLRETRIQARPEDVPLMSNVSGNITMYSAVEVSGGEPIAFWNGVPVIAQKKVGSGRVVVIADHTIFREFVKYEPVFSYPDPNLKRFIENLFVSLGGREEDGI